jgi:hypothetical protein
MTPEGKRVRKWLLALLLMIYKEEVSIYAPEKAYNSENGSLLYRISTMIHICLN